MNALYPLFADLAGRAVLVVGGGTVAERKARALMRCGAMVRVGAPRITRPLRSWADTGRLDHLAGPFQSDWMNGVWLVIAATDDRVLNARIKAEADARRILANVVDDPALSSFQVPAVVDRAPLTLAVSSGGAAPVIARRVRERLEALIDPALGALVRLAGEHRAAIRAAWPDHGARRCFYDWLHDGPVLEHLRAGDAEAARELLRSRLDAAAGMPAPEPCVRRITPCPADPGQITLRQLRWLNEADVLIHDAPIREAVLSLARRDADRRCLDLGPDAPADVRETRIRALCAGYRNVVVLGAAVTPAESRCA